MFGLFKTTERDDATSQMTFSERFHIALSELRDAEQRLQRVDDELNEFVRTHGLVRDDYGDIDMAITNWSQEITSEFHSLMQRRNHAMQEFQSSLALHAAMKQTCAT